MKLTKFGAIDERQQYWLDNFNTGDSWRLFRIMSEFVDGFDTLSALPPSVSIFGSARTEPKDKYYKLAVKIAEQLAKAGYAVITGGGPGIMEAANKGATEGGGISVGLNITLPYEQEPNTFSNMSLNFKSFFVRKVMFIKYAMAFICMPGGFGTLDELFDISTLVQTGKKRHMPIILFSTQYWGGLIDWIKDQMLREGLISEEDLQLLILTKQIRQGV